MQVVDFECTKYKDLVNAHLPIPELNRYGAKMKALFYRNTTCFGVDDVEDIVL